MEMVNRYVYAVTQRLPQSQREDIAIELRGLIEDMLEERVGDGGNNTDKMVEEVLMELGSPRTMAHKYRGSKSYLIGPELYESFILVLKIVLISVGITLVGAFAIKTVINPVEILDHFIEFIVSTVTAIPQALGWVTLGFALGEYYGGFKAGDLKLDKNWMPSMLPPIPHPKKTIKRSEPIIAIVFYVILMGMFGFSSNYFGIFRFSDGEFVGVIPFLNEAKFPEYMPFLLLLLALFIVKECLKLISGKWTMKLVVCTTVVNLVALMVVYFMITSQSFWNPHFMEGLMNAGIVEQGTEGYEIMETIWKNVTGATVIIFIVALLWDIVDGMIKVRKK
ncbi:HAAS signaling domain-containing protein [Ornithinibacillus scapharcae]|uniref:HAAS signaling domain-containing protein n=1 Tax=Ornithinibacillus scapharcae TaxID=1147159 RepID=UPI000225C0E8|nr:hypothetical protein [Ornithinibacillus scapharcae]